MKNLASTFNEQMRRIYKSYLQSGGKLPLILDDLYAFAMRQDLWEPQPADIRKQFCKQMATALREDYFTDAKGRIVIPACIYSTRCRRVFGKVLKSP